MILSVVLLGHYVRSRVVDENHWNHVISSDVIVDTDIIEKGYVTKIFHFEAQLKNLVYSKSFFDEIGNGYTIWRISDSLITN